MRSQMKVCGTLCPCQPKKSEKYLKKIKHDKIEKKASGCGNICLNFFNGNKTAKSLQSRGTYAQILKNIRILNFFAGDCAINKQDCAGSSMWCDSCFISEFYI